MRLVEKGECETRDIEMKGKERKVSEKKEAMIADDRSDEMDEQSRDASRKQLGPRKRTREQVKVLTFSFLPFLGL
jgi:hypothetical protein